MLNESFSEDDYVVHDNSSIHFADRNFRIYVISSTSSLLYFMGPRIDAVFDLTYSESPQIEQVRQVLQHRMKLSAE